MLKRFTRAATILAAVLIAAVGFAPSAPAAVVSPGASTSHPFSDPVWYPLRGSVAVMGCATTNPNCASGHPDWAMDLLSHSKVGGTYVAQPIYAAGAGIVHIGQNIGNRCTEPSGLGSWVWVDHGGGVVSRYGHLSRISIREGQYVTPTTVLGMTGHSGEKTSGDCAKVLNYLNFSIRHNGIHGTPIAPPSLKVCVGTRAVSWPSGVRSTYTSWQKVPNGTVLDNAAGAGNRCIPSTVPGTTPAPSVALSTPRSGSLRTSWAAPRSTYKVSYIQVLLQLYHPANDSWSVENRHNIAVSGTPTTSYAYNGLLHKRLYQVRVSFCNPAGWSAPSAYHSIRVT
ncbi:MAG: hypothetical protein QOK02_985 [Mycobacterium sp.]|nr:hypothetical protein [Mycobacterium sp.]